MPEKIEYRSSKRSKAMIKKAFAKLLHEKDISKISVTNIVETAEISRGTFYAHYKDVNSLFEQIKTEELNKLISLIDELGYDTILESPGDFLNEALRYIEKDIEYYRMLFLSSPASHFITVIKNTLMEKILGENSAAFSDPKIKNEASVYISLFACGLSYTIAGWLNGELNLSSAELSAILSKILKKSFDCGGEVSVDLNDPATTDY